MTEPSERGAPQVSIHNAHRFDTWGEPHRSVPEVAPRPSASSSNRRSGSESVATSKVVLLDGYGKRGRFMKHTTVQ